MNDRRDDWAHGVDENLASLNAGQRVQDRESQLIRKQIRDHDFLLRGDPEKETDGQIARLHNAENEILLLKAVLIKDAIGGRGLVDRVEALESQERGSDRRLKVYIALIGLISALLVAVASNLDRIESFIKKDTDPLHQKIDRIKHPPRRRVHVVIDEREKASETAQDDPPKTDR